MKFRSHLTLLVFAGLLATVGCSKADSIEGQYNMTKGPAPGVVATFGAHTFALSSGASGSYEISKGSAILTGSTFSGEFKIEGDKLIGRGGQWEFERRRAGDTTPINTGPRGGPSMPTINAGKSY